MSRPTRVGNRRKLLVSDQAGKSNVLAELDRIGIKVDKDDPRIARAARGGEGARGDRLCLRGGGCLVRAAGAPHARQGAELFRRRAVRRQCRAAHQRHGRARHGVSMAVVKVKVDGETLISAGEGNGPVNALDVALRKDLGKYQSYIDGLELTDYRVRILNGGTEAVTRVLIESQDESGERWTTVGVSPNIIDASFQALMDSIVYKLVKSGATA